MSLVTRCLKLLAIELNSIARGLKLVAIELNSTLRPTNSRCVHILYHLLEINIINFTAGDYL
jgi:hypothetical protein